MHKSLATVPLVLAVFAAVVTTICSVKAADNSIQDQVWRFYSTGLPDARRVMHLAYKKPQIRVGLDDPDYQCNMTGTLWDWDGPALFKKLPVRREFVAYSVKLARRGQDSRQYSLSFMHQACPLDLQVPQPRLAATILVPNIPWRRIGTFDSSFNRWGHVHVLGKWCDAVIEYKMWNDDGSLGGPFTALVRSSLGTWRIERMRGGPDARHGVYDETEYTSSAAPGLAVPRTLVHTLAFPATRHEQRDLEHESTTNAEYVDITDVPAALSAHRLPPDLKASLAFAMNELLLI